MCVGDNRIGKLYSISKFIILAVILVFPHRGYANDSASWGPIGSPINLRVGYQSYFTTAWSGMILRSKKFYLRYLPTGSTVQWELGIHGPVVVADLREGRVDLGYVGDLPALTLASRTDGPQIRLIGVVGISQQLCDNVLVKPDTPDFNSPEDLALWLVAHRVAASFGGCSDRFAQALFRKFHATPKAYQNMTPTTIESGFLSGVIDAAMVQEPLASKIVRAGLARRALSGAAIGTVGGAFLAAKDNLVRERPDIIEAWLEAELDAQIFLASPENIEEVLDIAERQTLGFSRNVLREAIYGANTGQVRIKFPFVFTNDVRALVQDALPLMRTPGTLGPNALDFSAAEVVLSRRPKLSAPREILAR